MLPPLVLGTHNAKKRIELQQLVAPLGIEIRTLADFPNALTVVEDGDSFLANAEKKGVQQAVHLNAWVLGEDSGLAVDALDGAPGIYSARYSGPDATDDENNLRLVEALSGIPLERRTAHYVCQVVIANPRGEVVTEVSGKCHGRILLEPHGTAGFGYDPLFEVVEYHCTFGELGLAVKACLSHRARALRKLLPRLVEILGG